MKEFYIALQTDSGSAYYADEISELMDSLYDDGMDFSNFDFYLMSTDKKLKLTLGE